MCSLKNQNLPKKSSGPLRPDKDIVTNAKRFTLDTHHKLPLPSISEAMVRAILEATGRMPMYLLRYELDL